MAQARSGQPSGPDLQKQSGETLRRVDPREVIVEWHYYEPLIRNVIAKVDGGQLPDDVLTCIQLGDMQMWRLIVGEAIGITQIQTFPTYRLLLVYMVAGEHARDWLTDGSQQLEAFAKLSGCKFIDFQGRPGWERYAVPLGYGSKQIRMRKELL